MQRLSAIRDADYTLTQWGRWAYQGRGLALSFASITPFERMRSKMPPDADIDPEEAERVDRIVSRLQFLDHQEYEAVLWYYVVGKSYRKIAQIMGTNHKQVSDWVQGGRRFVEGALFIQNDLKTG